MEAVRRGFESRQWQLYLSRLQEEKHKADIKGHIDAKLTPSITTPSDACDAKAGRQASVAKPTTSAEDAYLRKRSALASGREVREGTERASTGRAALRELAELTPRTPWTTPTPSDARPLTPSHLDA